MILNLAVERGLELDRFTCFYDDAEEKWGHSVPGTEIPIRPMRYDWQGGSAGDSVFAEFGSINHATVPRTGNN